VPNRGSVGGVEDDAVVELVCRVDRNGAHPLPVGDIPLAFRGVMLALKAYETLTVEAAVQRSKRLAKLALLNHPLVGDLDVIEPLVEEMLAAHGLDFA
jgi:6-phospho-beta-glucosidase